MASESKIRSHKEIQKLIQLKEDDRRRKILSYRLELARRGIVAYRKGQVGEAVRAFRAYLKILEEVKDVVEGDLTPSSFDQKKEMPELMMLSGVYWDLVKIFDRTRSPDLYKEFVQSLDKYVLFAKGMPHQKLCAETLRKYVKSRTPVHRDELKIAYESIGDSRCFIVSSLLDLNAPQTLVILRDFRDQVLSRSSMGRKWISWYYSVGPGLAVRVNRMPNGFRRGIALILDITAFIIWGAKHAARLVDDCSNAVGSKDKLPIRKINPKR